MTCVGSSKTELCGNLGDDAEMIHRRYDTALLLPRGWTNALQRIAQTGSSISIWARASAIVVQSLRDGLRENGLTEDTCLISPATYGSVARRARPRLRSGLAASSGNASQAASSVRRARSNSPRVARMPASSLAARSPHNLAPCCASCI